MKKQLESSPLDTSSLKVSGESVILAHIQRLTPYLPPLEGRNPKDNLLLDFNEKVDVMPASIRNALHDYIDSGRLQTYPSYSDTTELLADYVGVESSQILLTNGSDQGIELVFRSCCQAGDEVIIPSPTFAMYKQCAAVQALKVHTPLYEKKAGFPLQQVLAAINKSTKLIVLANPNNPCGTALEPDTILRIANAAPHAAILVDECYFEYTQKTVATSCLNYPNLFVTRTFSKTWGMPSLRFGYLVSHPQNIQSITCVRGPYDINQLAVVAARAALNNRSDVDAYVNEVMQVSKPLLESFLQSKHVSFWKSEANYLWAFFDNPESVAEHLAVKGILVRPKQDSLGKTGLRITLGNRRHTQQLIEALDELI